MVNDTANVTSEIIICKVAEKQRSTNSPVVAACVYRGLLPGPRGKFGLQLQSDSNFVRPVWLARILGNLKSKFNAGGGSIRPSQLRGGGRRKTAKSGGRGGCKVDEWLSPNACRNGMPGAFQVHSLRTLRAFDDGIVRIEKNPTIIELENRSFDPRTSYSATPRFLGSFRPGGGTGTSVVQQ